MTRNWLVNCACSLIVVLLMSWSAALVAAETEDKPLQGAELLKTDILVLLAHPDDEVGLASTLAYYALDQGKTVVNLYCTRGEGGGNMVGRHWGSSLGMLRETELRECLTTLGVRSCYFLDCLDWAYTESAAATLRKWGKEQTLERIVRMIRVLRPDVVLTMNPTPRPGAHGHHQAAGILTVEAVRLAADESQYPLQISKEGLTAWQTRRLFIRGDKSDVIGTVVVDRKLADGRAIGEVVAGALRNHRSQGFGRFRNSSFLRRAQSFTPLFSYAPIAGIESDLLAGLPIADSELKRVQITDTPKARAVELDFVPRPALATYQRWIGNQEIEQLPVRFSADLPVVVGEENRVVLRLQNNGTSSLTGEVRLDVAEGWKLSVDQFSLTMEPRSTRDLPVQVTPPKDAKGDVLLKATLAGKGTELEAKADLHPLPRLTVHQSDKAPALDGSDAGWEKANVVQIAPTDLVQGKVDNAADSSGRFRLLIHESTLYVDIRVRDEAVVSNIASNDIKGHWRSDSIEICLDPEPGSEDTLGAFKLGVFPFDSNGVVRGARDADARQGLVEETSPGTVLRSFRTDDGYRIIAAIPLSEVGMREGQSRLGFNLLIYDGDKRDADMGENINQSRLAWSPRPGVQGRPDDWGRIDLE